MASVHIVKDGDNLTVIAKKYAMSLGEILALNPSVRENQNLIHPGMAIKISNKIAVDEVYISRMLFNGNTLTVYGINNDRILAEYPAISGLPPNAPHLAELIEQGRGDLDIEADYTLPRYQNVKDAGPIQEGHYTLPLKQGMSYDKSYAAGDGLGWGEGGWILAEHFWAKVGNIFGGRFGFFLHHDGGARGTSGCIGLKNGEDLKGIKQMLINAHLKGQKSVLVDVKYQ